MLFYCRLLFVYLRLTGRAGTAKGVVSCLRASAIWGRVQGEGAFKISFLVSKAYHLNNYQCIPIFKKGKEYILGAIEQMCNAYK